MPAEGDLGTASWNGGRSLLGLVLKMPAAATVELAGHAGFDFVLIDGEHGSSEMAELEHHIRAADSAGIRVLVRVSDARSPDILRSLDAGAHGIVVPHVMNGADVKSAASLVRYPPNGRRSLALSTRAGRHGARQVDEHLRAAEREVAFVGQLEDGSALERIDEILGEDGLTGIFIGPVDLSMSLGCGGRLDHPVVEAAIDRIAEAVLARPELVLCVLVGSEEEARRWMDRGAKMVMFNGPALMASRLAGLAAELVADSPTDT